MEPRRDQVKTQCEQHAGRVEEDAMTAAARRYARVCRERCAQEGLISVQSRYLVEDFVEKLNEEWGYPGKLDVKRSPKPS
jgi:hypothetical protein